MASKNYKAANYTVEIEVAKSSRDVFKAITDHVVKWWGGTDLKGSSTKLNDEFVIHHPGAHYSKQKLVEIIPDKKIVWLVTESEMSWLEKDKHEWTNTKMIFDIAEEGDKTLLRFTHKGLIPEKECYQRCAHEGWDIVIKDWLFNFITEGNSPYLINRPRI
jgi:hypothetical protein